MRTMRIGNKLLLITILMALLPSLVVFFNGQNVFSDFFDKETERTIRLELQEFQNKMDLMSQQATITALACAEMPFVKEAYELHRYMDNTQGGAALIESGLQRFKERLSDQTEYQERIHFHHADHRSFYRSWSYLSGDDLGHRGSLREVISRGKNISGLEVIDQQLSIRGVCPVYSDNLSLMGSVEVYFPFATLLDSYAKVEKQEMGVFLRAGTAGTQAEGAQASAEGNPIAFAADSLGTEAAEGSFSLHDYTSPEFLPDLIDSVLFVNVNLDGMAIQRKDDFIIGALPLKNYQKQNIGYVVVQIDYSETLRELGGISRKLMTNLFVFYALALLVFWFMLNRLLSAPLRVISEKVKQISTGAPTSLFAMKREDEIGKIAEGLNKMVMSRKQATEFARQIGNGNFESDFQTLSKKDELGNALLEMRQSFKQAKEKEDIRRVEDQKLNWTTKGLATFGDILRENNNDIQALSDEVIRNMVHYLGANLGGVFLFNDNDPNDPYLELVSTYAFNRKKMLDKKVRLKESLVGSCAKEKETVYMSNVPDGYITITSGLGEATPNHLLLVPLKNEGQVLGVLEIASFRPIEEHEVKFVERIAENMASTLSVTKINERTARLLAQSQEQAQELRRKEEDMRDHMENLKQMQEQAEQKEAVASSFVDAVNRSIIRADFDTSGRILYSNAMLMRKFSYDNSELQGRHFSIFMDQEEEKRFSQIWKNIAESGGNYEDEVRYKTKKGYIWLLATYTAIKSNRGEVVRVLFLAIDISKQKEINARIQNELIEKEEESASFLNAMNHSTLRADYELNGTLLYANTRFLELVDFVSREVVGKHISQFLPGEEREDFMRNWEILAKGGRHIEREMLYLTKTGEVWIYGTYTLVRDRKGVPQKVLFLGVDVTRQRRLQESLLTRVKKLEEE